jgi:esterase/lipase
MTKAAQPLYHSAPLEDKSPRSLCAEELSRSRSSNNLPTLAGASFNSHELTKSIQPPPRSGLIREPLGFLELPRLMLRFPALARQPRGRGQPVLVLPGYGASNISTVVLQGYLRLLGYGARGCGHGIYKGEVSDLLRRVLKRLISMAYRSEQRVCLIGWSLGGYLAREAARERPNLVHQVITLGTPVIGGPKYTVVADVFRRRGIDVEAIASEIDARNQIAFTTPVTAIYSRADAVVAWEACIDRHGLNVEHVEVATTHLGLGFSPEVYKIIAQRLANGTGSSHTLPPDGSTRSRIRRRRRR